MRKDNTCLFIQVKIWETFVEFCKILSNFYKIFHAAWKFLQNCVRIFHIAWLDFPML